MRRVFPRGFQLIGPVISTRSSPARHSISSEPPSARISTLRPVRPLPVRRDHRRARACPARLVSPVPRSQTRRRICSGERPRRNQHSHAAGTTDRAQPSAPAYRSARRARRSQRTYVRIAHVRRARPAQTTRFKIELRRIHRLRDRNLSQRNSGEPISTVINRRAAQRKECPPHVSIRRAAAPPSSIRSHATHRVAFPHASTSPPLEFQMRMYASPRIERSTAIT